MTYKEAEAAAYRLYKALKDEACDVTLKRYMPSRCFKVVWKIEDKDACQLGVSYSASDQLRDVTSLHCCAETYNGGLRMISDFDFVWKSK